MNFNIPLLLFSLVYLILITLLFFSKKKIKNNENKIYTLLLFVNIIGILVDIAGIYAHLNLPDTSIIRWLIVKVYLLYLLTFVFLVTVYVVIVANYETDSIRSKKTKKLINLITFIYTASSIFNFFLPFSYYNDGTLVYIYGPNAIFLYVMSGLGILMWLVYIFKNRKTISKKKVVPIITFSILAIPVIFVQISNPEFLLVTSLSAFITVFMYHTIENPDLKMIASLSESKNVAEKSNNEKALFLFDMSQRLKNPIKEIENMSENILNTDDSNIIKEEARDINTSAKTLSTTINGLLGISSSESHNIEIHNNKYNLELLLKSVIASNRSKIEGKGLKFRTNIDGTLPKNLMGDSIRVKQIINIILNNAIKYTDKGYIEFDVNAILKYDSCRLMIAIEDSGIGIESEKLYHLLEYSSELEQTGNNKIDDTEENLRLAQTLTNLIGGTILASSELGSGSKFTIILDQKIIKEEKNDSDQLVEKYEDTYTNNKILVVGLNDKNKKSLNKVLGKYNLEVEYLTYGVECLKKMRDKENCDLILMNEELPKLSSYDTMKKLQEISNFNVPVIVMVNKKSDLVEKYDSYGFSDSLILPVDRNDISKIIEKYVNVK